MQFKGKERLSGGGGGGGRKATQRSRGRFVVSQFRVEMLQLQLSNMYIVVLGAV
jgi:hypothetical protein